MQQRGLSRGSNVLTHAIRTFFGNDVFVSFTFTKANWILPSENSSIKSTSSPSIIMYQLEPSVHSICLHTSSTLDLQYAFFTTILLESADERGSN